MTQHIDFFCEYIFTLNRFSLLKCPSILNSELRSPRGEVQVTDHLRLPLMRHPATLITMPIPASYYYIDMTHFVFVFVEATY